MDGEFCYLLRVRYAECDAQKVVFNGRYVDYIDIAVTEFMRKIWGNYGDLIESGIDQQVVNLTLSWKAPARFDEVVAITVKPSGIGRSSYSLKIGFYNYKTSALLATGEIVYVMVSSEELEKMNIPQKMREQLEKGAAGVIVDHSGTVL